MSHRTHLAGFYSCFLPYIPIDHIDEGLTSYQDWKHRHSGEQTQQSNSVITICIMGLNQFIMVCKLLTTTSDISKCGQLKRSLIHHGWDFHFIEHEWKGFDQRLLKHIIISNSIQRLPTSFIRMHGTRL